MDNPELLLSENYKKINSPFPHFTSSRVFDQDTANSILYWLQTSDDWNLTKTSFYTQYEYSLYDVSLPSHLNFLCGEELCGRLRLLFEQVFNVQNLVIAGITAHKLVGGHRMGVHNDFIGDAETHRLVIQFNRNWRQENGGFLMLFNSRNPNDVATVISPVQNTALGFEISSNSYHAVSTVHDFERYTLVYTLKLNNK